ncbi:iron complex outermembrane receptor protein [Algoriphagus sp. 4150]|uniref:TonB-dependent siderophore receptor n=1 Tax=Algoriphagus sp. 4150 TaxID=2817756 RepID=UPI002856D3E7|nr:TonB-dependent siderophore receptor [Algoriphagus sp. 4150]MDR7130283.1 iron complex outermembrane receptor protein [Algoriphagus sp. 4150]
MKLKFIVFLFFPAFFSLPVAAQVLIRGIVRSQDNSPLPGAAVQIQHDQGKSQVITDVNGYFELSSEGENAVELEIRFLGYKTYRTTVVIDGRSGIDLGNIVLADDEQQLQTIEVIGRIQRDYTSDYSFSATKIGVKNKDLPQALSVVTKELIDDRQAYQLAEAVKTVSGVSSTGFYNHFNIRGITQNEDGQILNGMRTHQFFFLQPITANIERVEVLKGPASVTFSSVDPGGSINMVTKKPLKDDRKEIRMSVGSFSTFRGTLDFTGPINEEKTLLYRLNIGVQEGKSFRDQVKNDAFLVSPSISYVPNDRTAINVEMIYSDNKGTLDRGQPIFGAQAGVTDLNSTPISRSLGARDDFFRSTELVFMSNLSQKLTRFANFNLAYMKQTWTEDLSEHRTTNAFAVDIENNPIPSMVSMRYVDRQQFWDTDNLSAYFDADFNTGKVGHKILVGYDLSRWHQTKGGKQNSARGYLRKDGTVTNGFDPTAAQDYLTYEVNGTTLPMPNVPHFDLNNPVYETLNTEDYNFNSIFSIPPTLTTTNSSYVQYQVKFGKLSSLISLRQEWFENITNYNIAQEASFKNSALIPRIGLTYGITKDINVYATYLEGYQPQSNTVTLMPSTEAFFWNPNSAARFKPLISDLKEIGAKGEFLDSRLSASVALYEINQKNILMNANLPEFPDSLVQRGADRSRGLEVELNGYISSNWQVNATYSYINAEIVRDADNTLNGKRKENTPINSANLWTRYDFAGGLLDDIGVGLGVQYSGDKIPWFTRDFTVPEYTLVDMAIYYAPEKSDFQLTLKVNNLLDKTYWVGAQNYLRLFPGAPRNMMLTATYQF